MAVEKRDLQMEAHIQAIALWYWIAAAICVLAAGAMVLFLKDSLPGEVQRGMKAGMVVGVVMAAASYAFGSYLMKYSEGARITAGLTTALTMLVNLVAIVRPGGAAAQGNWGRVFSSAVAIGWCAVLLWAFFNPRASVICTEEYRAIVKATPDMKPRTFASPFFWVPFILIGVSMAVSTAFWFSHRSG